MKKIISTILCLVIILSFVGCSNNSGNNASSGTTEQTSSSSATGQKGIDVDLTSMSGTVVYSEVYNMQSNPEDYVGKRVKMSGQLTAWSDSNTGTSGYACIIADATACCQQGIEFVPVDVSALNDKADGSNITVEGIFDTYTDGGLRYCTLREAFVS